MAQPRIRRRRWKEGLFYEFQLRGPAPDRLRIPLTPIPTGRYGRLVDALPQEGAQNSVTGETTGFWQSAPVAKTRYFNAFHFLPDAAAGGEQGRALARSLIDGWVIQFGRYDSERWQPDLTAARLWSLFIHGSWVLQGAPATWRSSLLTSIGRQARHLGNTIAQINAPRQRLEAAISLCMAGLQLPYHDQLADQGATLLRRELRLQVNGDGAHISRNPAYQLMLTRKLQHLVQAFRREKQAAPGFLSAAVARLTDMLEFYRCGDGRLAVFHGGDEGDGRRLAAALDFDPVARNRIDFASQSGFQKLTGGRTSVMVDVGLPDHARQPGVPDGGAFAFQVAVGRQRLIVNCGTARVLDPVGLARDQHDLEDWHHALRHAAAHSTVGFDAVNDDHLPDGFRFSHNVEEDHRGQLLELKRVSVDGTLTHQRRLYLSADGTDLRGEEAVELVPDAPTVTAVSRYHLHPTVKASLARDGRSVVLALPNSEGWRFKLAGSLSSLSLEKSVYLATDAGLQATQQIVVRVSPEPGSATLVKWALQRD